MEFHDRISSLRARLGITQGQLAERLGISGNYLSQVMGGRKTPGDQLLKTLDLLERLEDLKTPKPAKETDRQAESEASDAHEPPPTWEGSTLTRRDLYEEMLRIQRIVGTKPARIGMVLEHLSELPLVRWEKENRAEDKGPTFREIEGSKVDRSLHQPGRKRPEGPAAPHRAGRSHRSQNAG